MAGNVPRRLYGPANAASGDATILTLDEGHRYMLTSIKWVNNTTGKITVKAGLNGTADDNLILPATPVPAKGRINERLDDIMDTTDDTMQINASASGTTVTVYGIDIYPHL